MIRARTIVLTDPSARANVFAALAGRGAPAGVASCVADGDAIVVAFDSERTPVELIDALVAVATRFVPAPSAALGDRAAVTALAALGLNEPELDTSRLIETYLA